MQKDNEEFVLVLGSKPNSKIPKIKVSPEATRNKRTPN